MTGFASKLMNSLFKKAPVRPAAVRRRAALGLEPLEVRAVLSTVVPTTVADDVVVDGRIITGQDFNSPRSGGGAAGGSGGGTGKVSMNDFHFVMLNHAAIHHTGGANFLFGDGSVRFIKDPVDIATTVPSQNAQTGTHGVGGGGGAGKVSMQDIHFVVKNSAAGGHVGGVNVALGDGSVRFISHSVAGPASDVAQEDKIDPADVIVGAGPGAPGGHVKAFDGTSGAELQSFFAFQGFNGGVYVGSANPYPGFTGGIRVATGDVNNADVDDGGHGTHVAGTIGSEPRGSAGTGTPTGTVTFFDSNVGATRSTKADVGVIDTGIDYSHPDLYMNVWVSQALESILDDLASEPTRHG